MVRYDAGGVAKGRKYVRSGGGGKMASIGGGGMGIIGLIMYLLLGGNGATLPTQTDSGQQSQAASADGDDNTCNDGRTQEFMCFLMGDINETWETTLAQYGQVHEPTTLTIFQGSVNTNGCGSASAAVGPFYCPAPQDKGVYIDLSFYNELASDKFGAPGDFAQAYVIAHEVGHHISNTTGDGTITDSDKIRSYQQSDASNSNTYQIFLELQADCYAGIWANSASQRTIDSGLPIIEAGDLEEGLRAAASVGDDEIQKKMQGQIEPHKWTHGSAQSRQLAFTQGLQSGDPAVCTLEAMETIHNQTS